MPATLRKRGKKKDGKMMGWSTTEKIAGKHDVTYSQLMLPAHEKDS
jgi:hypothetical protein